MSSLWTPGGEHRIERAVDGTGTGTSAVAGDVTSTGATPNGRGQSDESLARAEMEELERQLAAAPAEDVVANHCFALFQLAALHLSQDPPGLEAARLAIDALAAIVTSLDGRLGDSALALRDGLAQIRLAYVQIAGNRPGEMQVPEVGADAQPRS